jgi:hypothetical protein
MPVRKFEEGACSEPIQIKDQKALVASGVTRNHPPPHVLRKFRRRLCQTIQEVRNFLVLDGMETRDGVGIESLLDQASVLPEAVTIRQVHEYVPTDSEIRMSEIVLKG